MDNSKKLIGPVFLVIGICLLAVGGYFVLDILSFTKNAVGAEGEVISVREHVSHKRDTGITYQPTIRFESADGRTHNAETRISSSTYNYDIGARVDVLYAPDDPSEVRINSLVSLYAFPGIFTLIGLIFSLIGAFVWRYTGRRSRQDQVGNSTVWRDRDH